MQPSRCRAAIRARLIESRRPCGRSTRKKRWRRWVERDVRARNALTHHFSDIYQKKENLGWGGGSIACVEVRTRPLHLLLLPELRVWCQGGFAVQSLRQSMGWTPTVLAYLDVLLGGGGEGRVWFDRPVGFCHMSNVL